MLYQSLFLELSRLPQCLLSADRLVNLQTGQVVELEYSIKGGLFSTKNSVVSGLRLSAPPMTINTYGELVRAYIVLTPKEARQIIDVWSAQAKLLGLEIKNSEPDQAPQAE